MSIKENDKDKLLEVIFYSVVHALNGKKEIVLNGFNYKDKSHILILHLCETLTSVSQFTSIHLHMSLFDYIIFSIKNKFKKIHQSVQRSKLPQDGINVTEFINTLLNLNPTLTKQDLDEFSKELYRKG